MLYNLLTDSIIKEFRLRKQSHYCATYDLRMQFDFNQIKNPGTRLESLRKKLVYIIYYVRLSLKCSRAQST